MSYFKNFFRFPSVEVDFDNELVKLKRSESYGNDLEFNVEYALPFVEIGPDNEVYMMSEAWHPSQDSFTQARDDNFFPCTKVVFSRDGEYIVNWTIDEFKERWSNYKDNLPKVKIVEITNKEELMNFFNLKEENEKTD